MIQTKCSKCGADLILHEGYGVCSNCGEIIGFDVEEEKEEVIKESVEETEVTKKIPESSVLEEPQEEVIEATEAAENIENDAVEYEEAIADEVQDEVLPEEKEEVAKVIEEVAEENTIPEEIKKPKKKKTPITILVVVILCILAVLGGYFISKVDWGTVGTDGENTVPEEDIIEGTEEPKAIDEEFEEAPAAEPELNEEPAEEPEKTPAPAPAPAKTETPKKETVKKEDAVISQTPSISYRIRKSADDSTTQIGAFSDLERAKAFATTHAADGYKVFDMYGNLIFQP